MYNPSFQGDSNPLADIDAFIAALDDSDKPRALSSDTNRILSRDAARAFGDNRNQTGAREDDSTSSLETAHENDSCESTDAQNNNNSVNLFDQLEDEEGISPSVHDVIFGKGGRSKHPGNEAFRAECERLAPLSLANPSKKVRQEIVMELVGFVYQKGGRFLMEDPNTKGSWRRAGFDLACKKAKQLLADTTKRLRRARRGLVN